MNSPETKSGSYSHGAQPQPTRLIVSALLAPIGAAIMIFIAEVVFMMYMYGETAHYRRSGLPSAHDVRFWLPRFLKESVYAYAVCAVCLAPIAIASIFFRRRIFVVGCSALIGGVVGMFAAYVTLPIGHGGGNIDINALLFSATLVGIVIGAVIGFVFCLLAGVGRRIAEPQR